METTVKVIIAIIIILIIVLVIVLFIEVIKTWVKSKTCDVCPECPKPVVCPQCPTLGICPKCTVPLPTPAPVNPNPHNVQVNQNVRTIIKLTVAAPAICSSIGQILVLEGKVCKISGGYYAHVIWNKITNPSLTSNGCVSKYRQTGKGIWIRDDTTTTNKALSLELFGGCGINSKAVTDLKSLISLNKLVRI